MSSSASQKSRHRQRRAENEFDVGHHGAGRDEEQEAAGHQRHGRQRGIVIAPSRQPYNQADNQQRKIRWGRRAENSLTPNSLKLIAVTQNASGGLPQ